jgi:hypothetical protein
MINLIHVKVFDTNNPNFKILNTPEEIKELLSGNKIPIGVPNDAGHPIGFLNECTDYSDDGIFYGNVFIWHDEYKNYTWKNYGVHVNDDTLKSENSAKILGIDWIEFSDKNQILSE